MEEKKRVQTGSLKASQVKTSIKESTEHYRSNNAYRTEDKVGLNSTNKTPETMNGIKVKTTKSQIPTESQQNQYTNPIYLNASSKAKSTEQMQIGGQTIQSVQRTVKATKQTNIQTEIQKVNRATENTQAISRPHVVAGNVRGIATLSRPVTTIENASTGNVQTGSQKQQEAIQSIQRASEISKKGRYQTTIQTGKQIEKDISGQSRLAPYQNKMIGLNLGAGNVKSALHFCGKCFR